IKENPGAAATATGVDDDFGLGITQRKNTSNKPSNAMSLYAKDAHKAVARVVGYVLTLGDTGIFMALSDVMALRLDSHERAAIAFASLRSMNEDDAVKTIDAYLSLQAGSGMPWVPTNSYMDEAAFWADRAAPRELEAYCLATFSRMTEGRQADFLTFAERRSAA
ncbi:hypothetical protein, partial [Roseobacter litoralis]|uniref:hypothetical protein n=1 Tax=Roseobacter litoralis TaxID=42443 RepID=UPI0024956968